MTISQRGQLVQLRSGGPLLTVLSLSGATGKARCVWFAPGRAIAESGCFAVDTLHHAPKLCREGGLWGRWRSEANKRKMLLGANQIWPTAEPWWLAEPDADIDVDFESEEWDEEESEEFEDVDRDADDGESFDLNSENFARSHAEGWYYDDDGTDGESSDEADSDEDEEDDDEDDEEEDEEYDDDEDDDEEVDYDDGEEDEDDLEDDEG